MIRYLVSLLLSLFLLSGCDAFSTLKDGFEQSQAVANDLEKSVGSKPFVGFNWNNGILSSVTVNFEGIPSQKSVNEIADLARTAIKSQFKQEPKHIVLGFSIAP
ncbi:MAG: hypothetical protein ACM31P_06100 [Actinomycetota bacterium]